MAAAASWLPLSRHSSCAQPLGCPGRLLSLTAESKMSMVKAQVGTQGHTAQKWEGPPGLLAHSTNKLNEIQRKDSRNLAGYISETDFLFAIEGLFLTFGELVSLTGMYAWPVFAPLLLWQHYLLPKYSFFFPVVPLRIYLQGLINTLTNYFAKLSKLFQSPLKTCLFPKTFFVNPSYSTPILPEFE